MGLLLSACEKGKASRISDMRSPSRCLPVASQPAVFRKATESLADLFGQYCAPYWKEGQKMPKASKAFSWIPLKIVELLGLQNVPAVLVEDALDRRLMDSSFSVQERARCLMGIYASLPPKIRAVFEARMLTDRKS